MALALVLAGAVPVIGQIAGGPCARCNQVPHQPYMAEFKITHVQTLADGTTITRENKQIEALDSQGRRLSTTSMEMGGLSGQSQILRTSVHDPVENTEAWWDTQGKTARVTKLPPEDQRHGCWANDSGNYRANYGPIRTLNQAGAGGAMIGSSIAVSMGETVAAPPPPMPLPPGATSMTTVSGPSTPVARTAMPRPVQEDLGSDVIQGVEVIGHRTTRTIPVGQVGNDRPMVTTTETWSAPSLGGLTLRSVSDGPQMGRQTREAVSLNIGDPDPSVFQPPEGYKVTVDVLHEVPCQQNQP